MRECHAIICDSSMWTASHFWQLSNGFCLEYSRSMSFTSQIQICCFVFYTRYNIYVINPLFIIMTVIRFKVQCCTKKTIPKCNIFEYFFRYVSIEKFKLKVIKMRTLNTRYRESGKNEEFTRLKKCLWFFFYLRIIFYIKDWKNIHIEYVCIAVKKNRRISKMIIFVYFSFSKQKKMQILHFMNLNNESQFFSTGSAFCFKLGYRYF